MGTENLDVVVVGLGPGGEHAAIRLGRAGLDVVADARRVPDFGGTSEVRPDWSLVARRVRELATDDWDDKVAVERLVDSGVTFVRDTARLAGPGRVEVGDTTYVASRGVVLGGGTIGCEFAQIFARFGVSVTMVEAASGCSLLQPGPRRPAGDRGEAFWWRPAAAPTWPGIGLETVGLDPDAKAVETDERLRTGEKLWAVGDITGKGASHVSMYQAAVVVRDILGEHGPLADYRAVSRVAYTDPEVASVGMSEKQAREAGLDPVTAIGDLGARGWIAQEEGLIKVVVDPERDVLVGACVVGSTGGEILSMLATAVHAEIPVATLRSMRFAYPTYHWAVAWVLDDLDAD